MSSASGTHSERFPFGIATTGLSEVERELPAGEPPALPPNEELSVIGQPVQRLDGQAKVTGAARYTVDVALPGMLYGVILRAPFPHARVRSIDTAQARARAGVRAVLILADPAHPDTATLRYAGAPVAAVAAETLALAQQAAALIRVDYQQLPFVVGLEAAQSHDAPLVHDSESAPDGHHSGWPARPGLTLAGNVRGPAEDQKGDPNRGFSEAAAIVESRYRTQVQTHCCMEPHAVVADWRADGLTLHISTQFTAGVREEAAAIFGLPLSRVRVQVEAMGGGFGSKSSLGTHGRIATELSREASAPVRIVLTRKEEQTDAGNRPAVDQTIRLGARRDGTLTALAVTSHGTSGVGLGAGIGGFAQSIYPCPNFHSAQYDVFTNGGPGCAMRGPGNTPGAWGLEQAVDELAEKLAIDPVSLRDHIDPSPIRREERRIGAERFGWSARRPPGTDTGPVKRGLGMAQSLWPSNVQLASACEVRLMRDGSVEVLSSVQDIGTGAGTVLAQTVAEVFGLRADEITLRIGDTAWPAGPPSYGSRTTASITPPARTAAWQVLQSLFTAAGRELNAAPSELVARAGRIAVASASTRSLSFAEAAALIPGDRLTATASRADDYTGFRRRMGGAAIALEDLGGVQFAQVAVDTETGFIRVERVVAVHDCGRPMNPKLLESQVQGGVLMGLSYALFEERTLDAHTGLMVNPNLEFYKFGGAADAPEIDVIILESYRAESATDAYGVAEPANIATAPAIANAVYNAIGVRLRSLPMTPAAVLTALGKVPGRG